MALLNQLLADKDLTSLTHEDREFLVQRIDFALMNSKEVREIVAKQLKGTLQNMKREATVKA